MLNWNKELIKACAAALQSKQNHNLTFCTYFRR